MSSITYLGRSNNFISGITGILPGSVGLLQLPTNRRYHRLNFQASAIAYQNPQVVAFPGTGIVVTPTINAFGQITAATVSGTLANYSTGAAPLVIINDPTGRGQGAQIAVNFTAANAATATVLSQGFGYSPLSTVTVIGVAAATPAVLTPTVQNGVITALAVTSGGSGYNTTAANNTIVIYDGVYNAANGNSYRVGQGATAVVATMSTSAIATVTLTNGGNVAPTPPELVLSQIKMLVNGINMRDLVVSLLMRLISVNKFEGAMGAAGYTLATGELPIFFTEPWRNELQHNETTSWDLTGQSTFQLDFIVQPNITSPSLVGSYEFDFRRNARPSADGKSMVPFLNPIAQHSYSFPIPGGQYPITFLPVKYPILRMWVLLNSAAGAMQQILLEAVGNKIFEQTQAENQQMLGEYGFNPNTFSAGFVFDPDQRIFKALGFSSDAVPGDLITTITTASAGTATVVMETLPGAFR